jgi:hypothetical protein
VRPTVRAGEEGPLRVDAMSIRVRTKLEARLGPEERLAVMRSVEAEPEAHYALSNAAADVPPEDPVRVRSARHEVEEVFEAAEGEVGLAQYEVRSRVGRHHHVTLSPLALWFLCRGRRRFGGESPRGHRVAGARGLRAAAARPGAGPRADRRGGRSGLAAEGGGPDLPRAQGDRRVPASPTAPGYQLIK